MPAPTVAVIAPGAMGSGVAARLTAHGVEVRTLLAGRSPASVARAAKAGMRDATAEDVVAADIILSIVPPGQALALAETLAPALTAATRKPVYADCNAVSPGTVQRIAAAIAPTGATFVDGGIIGPPPAGEARVTRIYLSGPEAHRVAVLGEYGLDLPVLDGPIGFASAMKLSYAGITKGFTALGAMMMLAATRAGTAPALHAELSQSQPHLLGWLSRGMPKMPDKAYRWVAEMEEIAAFNEADPAAAALFTAAARFYERIAADHEASGPETAALLRFTTPAS